MKLLKRHWPIPVAITGAVGILGLVAGSLGMLPGFSAFNAQVSPSTPLAATTGTLTVALANGQSALANGQSGSFTQAVSNMAPGDFVERTVNLSNTGTVGVSAVNLSATLSSISPSGTPLFSGNSNSAGLQVYGQSCSTPWTASSGVYSCSGTTTTLFGVPVDLASLTATGSTLPVPTGSTAYVASSYNSNDASSLGATAGVVLGLPTSKNASGVSEVLGPTGSSTATAYILITAYLPPEADNAFQGGSGDISYTFSAVQRAGEAK